MSWAGLANNQTVSFNNLQDAVNTNVFIEKTAIPVSSKQITKTEADTYVYINTSYPPYSAKASNQLVVKTDLDPIPQVTINIGTQNSADGSGQITVYAWADTGLTLVDTNVTVSFNWTGDLFDSISDSVTINSGNNCGSGTFGGAAIGENTSTFDITGISPSNSSTQAYVQGAASIGINSCP